MLRLKLIPRFHRLLSSSLNTRPLSRGFAADTGDDDFFTDFLSQAPAPRERFEGQRSPRDSGRPGPRGALGGRGRGSGFAGGAPRGRGGRFPRDRFGERFGTADGGRLTGRAGGRRGADVEDNLPSAPVALTEEEMKERKEIDEKMEARYAMEEKRMRDTDDEDEDEDGEPHSIYEGFIDPKYDDVIKEQKQLAKYLRYRDKSYTPVKFEDDDEEEDLKYQNLRREEDLKARRKAKQQRKRRATGVDPDIEGETDDDEDEEEDEISEEEVDEEEYDMLEEMDSDELEEHLKHRAFAKKLRKEYEQRLAELGGVPEDSEEVEALQKAMLRKWRAHDLIPRLVTPKEKEEMWEKHKQNPEEWTVDKLAEEYEVCKARVHAILFLWDIRKQQGESQTAEEETKTYLDSLCFDDSGNPCLPPHMGEDKWVTSWNTRPNYKIMPENWEGSVRTEEEAIEEASAKEEAMMLEEFLRRLEFNKLQMAGLIKQNKHDRSRPPDGWTYLVEKLGREGKRGKRGGIKFVATADGKHRKLNDLEKLMLKREAVRPRKRML